MFQGKKQSWWLPKIEQIRTCSKINGWTLKKLKKKEKFNELLNYLDLANESLKI